MHKEFTHIKHEVVSLIDSLSGAERQVVQDVMAEEMQDLDELISDVSRWLEELAVESASLPDDSTAIMETTPSVPKGPEPFLDPEHAIETLEETGADLSMDYEEPPVVFKDSEVRRILAELPIERPPQDELILRIEALQKELMNRENASQVGWTWLNIGRRRTEARPSSSLSATSTSWS